MNQEIEEGTRGSAWHRLRYLSSEWIKVLQKLVKNDVTRKVEWSNQPTVAAAIAKSRMIWGVKRPLLDHFGRGKIYTNLAASIYT